MTELREGIKRIGNDLVDAIFPPACPICAKPRPFKNGVRLDACERCMEKLEYISEPTCLKCGKALDDSNRELCYDCKSDSHSYNQAAAVYKYSDSIKKSIYNFKYHNKREYATFYAKEMKMNCGDIIAKWNPDVLIPVPIHASKLRIRGFNQAELIAEALGKATGIPVDTQSLERKVKTVPMKELDNVQRRKNLENAFKVAQNIVKYKKVLIVDDIYTTGATLDACATILKSAGVAEVYGLSLCIGNGF